MALEEVLDPELRRLRGLLALIGSSGGGGGGRR